MNNVTSLLFELLFSSEELSHTNFIIDKRSINNAHYKELWNDDGGMDIALCGPMLCHIMMDTCNDVAVGSPAAQKLCCSC